MDERLSPEQFAAFYAATRPALRSYVCRVAASETVADDILQESYIRMLNAPPIPEEKRKAYLYRVATNLVMDHQRALNRQRRWWHWAARPDEAASAGLDVKSDMRRLFGQIGTRERALLWLSYVEGAEHREIAERMHVNEKSVKVLLHRARRKMEAILRKHGYEAGHD
jgi:RNA polymerase sigma-70 factor (ECF subfamily)